MTKFGILMIGYAGLAIIPGCAMDSPDETQAAASELAIAPDVVPNAIGAFNTLRLSNTNPKLCLQPQGGSTAPGVLLELHTCDPSAPEQNWDLRPQPNGRIIIVNVRSGNCIYNNANLPLVNGARPIDVESCFLSNNPSAVASNALWKRRFPVTGFSSFESEIQARDTNFCIDTPNGAPFDGATFWNFKCNSTPALLFVVE